MNLIGRKNEIAMELASTYNKGVVTATDTCSGRIGKVYALSKARPLRSFSEI